MLSGNENTNDDTFQPSTGFDSFFNTQRQQQQQPQFKKANEYVTSHESSIRSRNRFQTTAFNAKQTTAADPPTTSTTTTTTVRPAAAATPTSRRTRFNPYRSIVTPKTKVKSTTTSTTKPAPVAIRRPSSLQSPIAPVHFNSHANLIPRQPYVERQPLYEDDDVEDDDNGDDVDDADELLDKQHGQNVEQHDDIVKQVMPNQLENGKKTKATEESYNESKFDDEKADLDDYLYENPKEKLQTEPDDDEDDDSRLNPHEYVKKNVKLLEKTNETKVEKISKQNEALVQPPRPEEPVILHSNFYLPNGNEEKDEMDDIIGGAATTHHTDIEYEYEYEEYDDDGSQVTTTVGAPPAPNKSPNVMVDFKSEPIDGASLPAHVDPEILGQAVVSVVTTKSVINGTSAKPFDEDDTSVSTADKVSDEILSSDSSLEPNNGNSSTESWVVVASVQTSRSVSGARFLPFPQVEQEEKKQVLSDLDMKTSDEEADDDDDIENSTVGGADSINEDLLERTTAISSGEPTTFSLDELEDGVIVDDADLSTDSSTPSLNEADTLTTELAPIATSSSSSSSSPSTESIIDKLDRVQSELSIGLLSGKFPIISNGGDASVTTTNSAESSTAPTKTPAVVIRRFSPRTTSTTTTKTPSAEKSKKIEFDTLPQDDLTASLLPFGFKPRNNSYRNKKVTTSTTTAAPSSASDESTVEVKHRNANISRSFKSSPFEQLNLKPKDDAIAAQDLLDKIKFDESISKLLPKDYNKGFESTTPKLVTITDNIGKFLPPGYKAAATATKRPMNTPYTSSTDNVNKFLPHGYKMATTTTAKPEQKQPAAFIPVADDLSKFLPPGYKPPVADELPAAIPIDDDIVSKLLPSGYRPPQLPGKKSTPPPVVPKIHKFSDNGLAKLLPPGFKAATSDEKENATSSVEGGGASLVDTILSKVKFQDVSALLPPGFKPPTAEATTAKSSGFKVVFPKALGKRPGAPRATTAQPVHAAGPQAPGITIRKGLR